MCMTHEQSLGLLALFYDKFKPILTASPVHVVPLVVGNPSSISGLGPGSGSNGETQGSSQGGKSRGKVHFKPRGGSICYRC